MMRTSEQLDKIAAALLAFQKAIEPPKKNQTADTGKFKYDYADLCSLFAHCKKDMIANGLVFTSCGLTSRLLHVSGQWIEGDFAVPADLLPQQMGSAMTYGRRYNFQGLLGINAEEDDDAQATQPKTAAPASGAKPYVLKPTQPKAAPQPSESDDRVPASVTDGQAPAPEVGAEPMEAVMLKAYSKEKVDKKGRAYRGVLLVMPDNEEVWFNCYHEQTIQNLQTMKGSVVEAHLEDKNGYKLCHKMQVPA